MPTLRVNGNRHGADSATSTAVSSAANSMDSPVVSHEHITAEKHRNLDKSEKGNGQNEGKFSVGITLRTVVMAALTAMGGFIFGYDTGQISGFLEMRVFLERFGQPTSISTEHPFGLYFTNVRSGLIVAMVSSGVLFLTPNC
jgi:SP family sugar:H+ symporter-like MFS transporter